MIMQTASLESQSPSANAVNCIICDDLLTRADSFCTTCQCPLGVSLHAQQRGNPPRFVPVLGASGAGKTVYLGLLLDIVTKGTNRIRGLTNSPFSVALQAETVSALEARLFPEKTASEADQWNWLSCELRSVKRPKSFIDLITPDFAGEAIAVELDHPGTYHSIRSVVSRCMGLVILCDSLSVRDDGVGEDLFAVKLAAYVAQLQAPRQASRRSNKLDVPVAVVFTKCDWCMEALDDPAQFAASHTPRMHHFCEQTFEHARYFAASVVGNSATMLDAHGRQMQVPLHIQPRGVVEPLEWIMMQG